jgi:hypothetical protein
MKFPWFRLVGLIYLPRSIMGWIILVAALSYAFYVFLDIDSGSHSASDTLINFAFRLVIIAAIYTLTGFLTSRERKKPNDET